MKGLLIKDLLNLKQIAKIYAAIIVVWAVLAYTADNSAFFGGVMMMLTVMVPLVSLSYDEKARWDRFALTMPLTRSSLVFVKYILMLICAAAGSALSLLIAVLISGDLQQSLINCLAFLSLGIIFASVILPFIFRFGVEKARLIMMIIVIIPTVLGLIVSKLGFPEIDDSLAENALSFAPLAAAVIWFVSLLISEAVYKRKEL